MPDVGRWLEHLGLAQYARTFRESDIDFEVLPHLSEQDLEELGVSLGHRKKVLHAIALLAGPQAPAAVCSERPRAPPHRRVEAERRQLTVMFVDLVGSTERAARLDPEDMAEVIRDYQMSPSTWATACWPISAGREPMRTMPSERSGRDWLSSKLWRR